MSRLNLKILDIVLLSFLVVACSDSGETAGATSETTNGFAFRIVNDHDEALPFARISLYSKSSLKKLDSTVADSIGNAEIDIPDEDCYMEGIAGADSSFMAFENLDTAASEFRLSSSASLMIRVGEADFTTIERLHNVSLLNTPYFAEYSDGMFVFNHVPSGFYELLLNDSSVHKIELKSGESLDMAYDSIEVNLSKTDSLGDDSTLADTLDAGSESLGADSINTDSSNTDNLSDYSGVFLFEDFDDGDSLNNFAANHPNYGWYFSEMKGATFERPLEDDAFVTALDSSEEFGYYLSTRFSIGDSGMVLIGTHIGEDSLYYDMSSLKSIRVSMRGDCNVSIALEHYEQVSEKQFNKALWMTLATDEWTVAEFFPGDEIIMENAYQVDFATVSNGIALFSIFATSGTFLEIDKIEFVMNFPLGYVKE